MNKKLKDLTQAEKVELMRSMRPNILDLVELVEENFEYLVSGSAYDAVMDNDVEELKDIVTQELEMSAEKWPAVAEVLWLRGNRWAGVESPFAYIKGLRRKKVAWRSNFDVDHSSYGKFEPGSLFLKNKSSKNKDPKNISSLDVLLEIDGYRLETDRGAWLDNEGILENDDVGILSTGEVDQEFVYTDPYLEPESYEDKKKKYEDILREKTGQRKTKPMSKSNNNKLKKWLKEAEYIQRNFIDNYYTKPFNLNDEKEPFVTSSYLYKPKPKATTTTITSSDNYSCLDEVLIIDNSQEYILHNTESVNWPYYHSRANYKECHVMVKGAEGVNQDTDKHYNVNYSDGNIDGTFKDITLDLNPEKRVIVDIQGIKYYDIERAMLKAGLSKDDVLIAKAWILRPYSKHFDGNIQNQYKPGYETVFMMPPDIAALLGWDIKRVNASIKKIKRTFKKKNIEI